MQRAASLLVTAAVLSACQDRSEITGPGDGPELPAPRFSVVVFGITDLGAPLGGLHGDASAVNDLGQVTGTSSLPSSESHAFVWTNGAVQDLGTLPDGNSSSASDINAHGMVVGRGTDFEPFVLLGRVVVWDNGAPIGLDVEEEVGGFITATAVNDGGQFVGFERFEVEIGGEETEDRSRALFWESKDQGFAHQLQALGGDHQQALDINNAGVIVGFGDTPVDARRAVVWLNENAAPQPLKSFDGGFDCSEAASINELGQIVGTCRVGPGESHAAFWPNRDAVPLDLGTLGGSLSSALGLNELGQVVGSAQIADGSRHAVLWMPEGQSFRIYDLGGLSGNASEEAEDVNNMGRAVGTSIIVGVTHAVLWTIPLLAGVDMVPGDLANLIKADGRGRVTVAVLTTSYFNAANVDPASLTLGNDDGNETPIARKKKLTPAAMLADVDRDGDRDLVAEFEESQLMANGDLTLASTRLVLLGLLRSGEHLRGSDAVTVVP